MIFFFFLLNDVPNKSKAAMDERTALLRSGSQPFMFMINKVTN